MLNFKSTNLSALWPKAGMIFSKITKPVYKRWSTLSKGLMLLGLILLVGLGLFSCKKEFSLQSNFQNEGSSLQKFKKFDWNVTEQSFFSLEDRFNSFKGVGDRTDNNKFIFKPLLVEAYNQIAEENNAQHFITNIANSAGFPIWNKSLVYKDSIGHNDLVIIPLSKTGFKIVSSYIMLYRNPTISSNRFNISSVTRSEVLDTAGVNASIKASQARWLLALDKHVFNLEDENLKSSYCEYLNNSNAGANGPAPNPPITPCQWQQFEICFTPGSSTFWIGGNSVLPPHLDHDHDGIPNQYDNDWNLLVNSGRITQDDFTRMVNEWWYDKYYDDFGSYNVFFDQFNDIQGGEPVNIDWDPLSYKLDDIMFHFDQFFGNILDDFRDGWYDLWHEVHCFDWGPVNGSATDREVICRYAWVYVCNDGTDNWWNNLINDLYGWEAPQDERDYIYQYWLSNNLGSYGIEFNDIANIVLQYCHEYGPGYEQCADAALLNFIQGNISLTANQISALQSNRILLAQIASFIYNHKNPAEIEAVKDIVYSRIRNSSLNITNDRLEQLLQIQKIAKLTADQLDWLLLHQEATQGIAPFIVEHNGLDKVDEAIQMLVSYCVAHNVNKPDEINLNNYGLENSPCGYCLAVNIATEYAILRFQSPCQPNDLMCEWGLLAQATWNALSDEVHLLLDGAGMVPVVGEVADLTSALIYKLEGDEVSATFSLAASITGAGWTSTGIKYARKVINNAGNKSVLKYIVRSSDNIIQFGSRSQLRNVLKTTTGKQAHHIIPWEFGENAVVQAASKVKNATAFHMNDLPNGISLPEALGGSLPIHLGSHPNYSTRIAVNLE